MSLEVICCNVGSLGTNCYLAFDSETKEAFVVDPGMYDVALKRTLLSNGITKLKYILLTHGHYDHILGAEDVKKDYSGQIVIHEDDSDCFRDKTKSLLAFFQSDMDFEIEPDIKVKDGFELDFAGRKIKVIHTPGHTEGSVCFVIDNIMFSGDTLFKGSVGRTDFPSGDFNKIMDSMQKLKAMDKNYKVLCGHGESTELEYEKKHNYYMR